MSENRPTFRWWWPTALIVTAGILAIANNLRLAPGERLPWIGGQEVFETPAEVVE